jgi:hypothetical protein
MLVLGTGPLFQEKMLYLPTTTVTSFHYIHVLPQYAFHLLKYNLDTGQGQ